jgi:hypothetical protein
MPLELKIRWQGVAPGLEEKRLSLGAFADPLAKLLASLRRIATNIISQAFDDRRATGRFANAARQLDIEITNLIKESSGFDSVITVTTPFGDTLPLLDLGESAGKSLLEALDAESRGIATNANVRNYLRSLPGGIVRQDYSLHRNGTVLKHVSFGEAALPELPPDLPYIAHFIGDIVGVGFEPGRSEVRIKVDSGTTLTFVANSRQVEQALNLRHVKIQAVTVATAGSHRLLILQPADAPIATSTREEAVYNRWQTVLKRLAQ